MECATFRAGVFQKKESHIKSLQAQYKMFGSHMSEAQKIRNFGKNKVSK